MIMEPVTWAGSKDVPGINVRKLVWMAWSPMTVFLMWAIIAKSRVPSDDLPALKGAIPIHRLSKA
jgi:hypothetical protein